MRRIFNYLFLAVILVGLPLFAWYYLTQGTKMRKDAMKELEPKAELSNFQSVTDSDSMFYSSSFKGKKWVVGVIGADSMRSQAVDQMKKMYVQAKEEFSLNVFTIIGLNSGELIPDMNAKLDLPKDLNWIKTYMAANHVFIFSEDAFSIPESHKNKNIVLLINEDSKVLQYYSLQDPKELTKLVRQLPVFLSLK